MSKGNFSDDFKRDAVTQITERGYPVSEVSQRLGVRPSVSDDLTSASTEYLATSFSMLNGAR